jgi:hypothetical protein
MSLWNLVTLAVATSTVVIGSYVYTHTGPRGQKGDPGEDFHVDVSQNLTDCDDFATIVDEYPEVSPSQPVTWLIETDSRAAYTGCPTVYDLKEADVTTNDLSGHLLIYNGSTWRDHGMFNGIQGADGTDGNTIVSGAIAPTTEGKNGDFYLNTATTTLYGPKASGTWPSGTSLIGATGANGANGLNLLNGAGAPSNGTGVDGEFYIDTSASTTYGPKASGTWGTGVYFKGNSVNMQPIFATTDSGDTYASNGSHQVILTEPPTISQSSWTLSGNVFTCNTTAMYEIKVLLNIAATSVSAAFIPRAELKVNGGTVQTMYGDIITVASCTNIFLHYVANFTASDTVQIVLVPNGPNAGDTLRITSSGVSIVRIAS